jgi:hypothetical protein
LNAILVGLGKIAFNETNLTSENTHFGGALMNNIKILFGIDTDAIRRDTFSKLTGINALCRIEELSQFKSVLPNIDCVIVAVSTNSHFQIIKEVLLYVKPKILICEKPFCTSILEAENLIDHCDSNSIKLIISYQRNYSLDYFTKLDMIEKQEFESGYMFVSPDISNHGSHLLALVLKTISRLRGIYGAWKVEDINIDRLSPNTFQIVHLDAGTFTVNINKTSLTGYFFAFLQFEHTIIVIQNNTFQIFHRNYLQKQHFWLDDGQLIDSGQFATDFFSLYSYIKSSEIANFSEDLTFAILTRRILSQIST